MRHVDQNNVFVIQHCIYIYIYIYIYTYIHIIYLYIHIWNILFMVPRFLNFCKKFTYLVHNLNVSRVMLQGK